MRDRIMEAVLKQSLKHGFRGFTMEDICNDLKISKKTIYKHFNSKDEIISIIVDSHVANDKANTLRAIDSGCNIYDRLKSAIMCYYSYTIPLKLVDELIKFYPQEWKKVEELFHFKQELFKKLISEGKEQGFIKDEVDIDILMLVIQKTIPAILDYEFLASHDRSKATANQMLEELCRLILWGIAKSR